jgi:beta-1,4-N-acetylglucosaminyltransferase
MRSAWSPRSEVWVTFEKPEVKSLLRDATVIYAHGPTNRNLPNLLRNLPLAGRVIRAIRPCAVVTTGAGVAVPFAWLAWMHRIPVIYVESLTRIGELSLTARLIAPVVDHLYVQWPELAEREPRALFRGAILEVR